MLKIADVSHHNGTIMPGRMLSAGIAGLIVKASDGTTFKDSRFLATCGRVPSQMLLGAYHFLRPYDVEKQADLFLSRCKALGSLELFTLGLWVDVEDPDDKRGCWDSLGEKGRNDALSKFLARVDAELARVIKTTDDPRKARCGIYCGTRWFGPRFTADRSGRRLWATRPGAEPPDLTPVKWKQADLWQYTFNGKVDGCQTAVDLSFMREGDEPWPKL